MGATRAAGIYNAPSPSQVLFPPITPFLAFVLRCLLRPMNIEADLLHALATLREKNLLRELRRVDSPQSTRLALGGETLLNFSSNDYLGLANDPILRNAAVAAVKKFGVGSGASRLVCGSLAPHHELEEALAHFKKTEAALVFSSGYAAAMGTISALVGPGDVLILDKLVHASIVDAARLSGAKLRVFAHNDLENLEGILQWAAKTIKNLKFKIQNVEAPRVLLVTESVFSMDGDFAPLQEIVALKEKYGAWLMIDEAHATGIFGEGGRGLAEQCGVAGQIEIQMGTLGKALGASGGYICGARALIDWLINRARSFVFSTAPAPVMAAAATAAIQFVQSAAGKKRRQLLWQRIDQLHANLKIKNAPQSAIVPWLIGNAAEALHAAAELRARNFFVPAIRYPSVARNTARLRITLTAAHTAHDVKKLCAALQTLRLVNRKS